MGRDKRRITLAAVVVLHQIVALVHGAAHGHAGVTPDWLSLAFILIVIQAGPLIGLVWMWKNAAAGARLIGLTMAASLLFGLINHFVLPGADRIDHVAVAARGLFATTAVMLVLTEAAGAALGLASRRRSLVT